MRGDKLMHTHVVLSVIVLCTHEWFIHDIVYNSIPHMPHHFKRTLPPIVFLKERGYVNAGVLG